MTSTPVGATSGASKASGTTGGTSTLKKNFDLKAEDFIKMMITQLQNQDPMEPAKNDQLLAQMSQIGQLQSATSLQDSLKGLVTQNQIGAAAGLIGKTVQGLDENDDPVTGTVTSVSVGKDSVDLELDNGTKLPLTRVTTIAPAAAAAAAPTAPPPPAATN
jgi:flagellar basal-body rod modification protein FlgD